MQELITISNTTINNQTVQAVNARDLHEFLESKQDFSTWIKSRIDQYAFVEGVDFTTHKFVERKVTKIDYHLSLNMGRELSMVERNEKGRQIRQYFIECERRVLSTPQIDLNSPEKLRLLLLDYTGMVLDLQEDLAQANTKLVEVQPKVQFYDEFSSLDGLYGLQNAGRALHCKPNLFIQWLKQDMLFYQGSNLVAKNDYIKNGWFELKSTVVDDKARLQTYVTPRGLKELAVRVPDHIKLNSQQHAC